MWFIRPRFLMNKRSSNHWKEVHGTLVKNYRSFGTGESLCASVFVVRVEVSFLHPQSATHHRERFFLGLQLGDSSWHNLSFVVLPSLLLTLSPWCSCFLVFPSLFVCFSFSGRARRVRRPPRSTRMGAGWGCFSDWWRKRRPRTCQEPQGPRRVDIGWHRSLGANLWLMNRVVRSEGILHF